MMDDQNDVRPEEGDVAAAPDADAGAADAPEAAPAADMPAKEGDENAEAAP